MCKLSDICLSLQDVFFFSSRRRHTSCLSDWSSDVCSSDLRERVGSDAPNAWYPNLIPQRSEERRVGKECRAGWLPHPEEKKPNNHFTQAGESRRRVAVRAT